MKRWMFTDWENGSLFARLGFAFLGVFYRSITCLCTRYNKDTAFGRLSEA